MILAGIGYMGNPPEFNEVGNDRTLVANFSMGIPHPYKKDEPSAWLKFEAWGPTAEFIEKHCFKGQKCYVEATPIDSSFEGQDRKMVYQVKYKISKIDPFLGSEEDGGSRPPADGEARGGRSNQRGGGRGRSSNRGGYSRGGRSSGSGGRSSRSSRRTPPPSADAPPF